MKDCMTDILSNFSNETLRNDAWIIYTCLRMELEEYKFIWQRIYLVEMETEFRKQ